MTQMEITEKSAVPSPAPMLPAAESLTLPALPEMTMPKLIMAIRTLYLGWNGMEIHRA